jgi:FHS family L-fucose permease-like MFS transporter
MNTAVAASATRQPAGNQTYRGPFAIMTILFFMWGFITVWNDILIPNFKAAFTLSNSIQFSFVVPMIAFAYIAFYGIYGYKAGRTAQSLAPV